jgi:FkbM family methyltransferase
MGEKIVPTTLPEGWEKISLLEHFRGVAIALLPSGLKKILKDAYKGIKDPNILGGQFNRTIGGVDTTFVISNESDLNRIVSDFESEREFGDTLITTVRQTPHPVFVDIGSAQGIYAIPAGIVGAEVHAYDPDPIMADSFKKNLQLNSLAAGRVRFHNQAIGDTEGTMVFYTDPRGNQPSSHVRTVKEQTFRIEAPVLTLDNLVNDGVIPAPDIIKIDTEGAEHLVLQGMRRLLKSEVRPEHIFIEIHQGYLPKFGSNASEVVALIEKAGYALHPGHFWKRRKELLCHFEIPQ